jgi:hypothetical protein
MVGLLIDPDAMVYGCRSQNPLSAERLLGRRKELSPVRYEHGERYRDDNPVVRSGKRDPSVIRESNLQEYAGAMEWAGEVIVKRRRNDEE